MAIILAEEILSETSVADLLIAQAKGRAPKKKAEEEDDMDDEEEETAPKKSTKKGADEDDDDDDDVDDAEPVEGDDDWDPDFEGFDLPKSRKGKGGKEEEEEDFKIEEDEEFKDLFNDSGTIDDEEEDF